jgi:DNA-directed RNA polymerase
MYEEACKYVTKEIAGLEASQKEELLDIIITRSLVKKAIMTIPYGISVSSLNEDLIEVFKGEKIIEGKKLYISIPGEYVKDGKAKLITGKNWGVLVNMIYKVLYSMHPVLKDFTDYLKDMSKLLLDLNCPVVWVTPSGMKINTTNIKFKAVKTKSSILKNSNPITISIPTDHSDKVKTLNGVTPNLIHSLDSSNIHLLIQKILNNKKQSSDNPNTRMNLYTIHDCFASTVDTMGEIERLVRESFADIYFGDKNYINTMHNNFINQIKSFTEILIDEKNREYIIIDDKKLLIPEIPYSILNNLEDNVHILRTSIITSPYLIN